MAENGTKVAWKKTEPQRTVPVRGECGPVCRMGTPLYGHMNADGQGWMGPLGLDAGGLKATLRCSHFHLRPQGPNDVAEVSNTEE